MWETKRKPWRNTKITVLVNLLMQTSHHITPKAKFAASKRVNGVAKFKIEVIGIDKKPSSNYEENISLEKLNKLNGTEQRIATKRYERSVQMNSAKSFKTNKVLVPTYQKEIGKNFEGVLQF